MSRPYLAAVETRLNEVHDCASYKDAVEHEAALLEKALYSIPTSSFGVPDELMQLYTKEQVGFLRTPCAFAQLICRYEFVAQLFVC